MTGNEIADGVLYGLALGTLFTVVFLFFLGGGKW